MTMTFHKLRHQTLGLSYIKQVGKCTVTRVKDESLGYDSRKDDLPTDKTVSPSSEMITFEIDDETVMTLRGSGTEPKLKYYIESRGTSMVEAKSKAEGVEVSLHDLFRSYGLEI
jgi:phosphomannomutase